LSVIRIDRALFSQKLGSCGLFLRKNWALDGGEYCLVDYYAIRVCSRAYVYKHAHAYAHIHIHTRTSTHTHAHTHTHTHLHTHTCCTHGHAHAMPLIHTRRARRNKSVHTNVCGLTKTGKVQKSHNIRLEGCPLPYYTFCTEILSFSEIFPTSWPSSNGHTQF